MRRKGGDMAMRIMPLALLNVILATILLTSVFFMNTTSTSSSEYDPWIDTNDDGIIDILDLVAMAKIYGSNGTPINKTTLLYNVNDTFTKLLSKIDALNTSLLNLEAYCKTRIAILNATIAEQKSRIAELDSKITALNATKLGEPDWDSLDTYGWISIPPGEFRILTHNLQTTNVTVYMVGYDFNGEEFHQIDYGGEKSSIYNWGACWSQLTATTIKVTRFGSDYNWDLIRVLIWKIP